MRLSKPTAQVGELMVFVEIGRGSARILDKCNVIGVRASGCIHSYSVLTYLQLVE